MFYGKIGLILYYVGTNNKFFQLAILSAALNADQIHYFIMLTLILIIIFSAVIYVLIMYGINSKKVRLSCQQNQH